MAGHALLEFFSFLLLDFESGCSGDLILKVRGNMSTFAITAILQFVNWFIGGLRLVGGWWLVGRVVLRLGGL